MLVRPRLLLAVLPLGAVLLAGCGGSSDSESQPTAAPSSAAPSSAPATAGGEQCRELAAKYPDQLATLRVIPPDVLEKLRANPTDPTALAQAQQAVSNSDLANDPGGSLRRILQLKQASPSDLQLLIGCAGVSAG